MNDFLTSNEWQWRLLRTIAQGVLGVVVANIDLPVGVAVLEPTWRALVMAVPSPLMAGIGKGSGEGSSVLERAPECEEVEQDGKRRGVHPVRFAQLHCRAPGQPHSQDCGALHGTGGGSAPSGDVSDLAHRVINGEFGNGGARMAAPGRQLCGGAEARERDTVMTRQKLREEVAWWLAVIAARLLCLVLLPLCPLCWVVDRFENEFRD